MEYLECHQSGSHKFWSCKVKGKATFVEYGKVGGKPTVKETLWPSAEQAKGFAAKLKAEKLEKGYVEASKKKTKASAPAADEPPKKKAKLAPKQAAAKVDEPPSPKTAAKAKAAPKKAAAKAEEQPSPTPKAAAKAKAAPKKAAAKAEDPPSPAPKAAAKAKAPPKKAAAKAKAAPSPLEPPADNGKQAAATPETPASPPSSPTKGPRTPQVDREVPQREKYVVHGEYHCKLNQTNIQDNNNKYYIIQLLHGCGKYYVWTRWGRVGESGQNMLMPYPDEQSGIKGFMKKFKEKTINDWDARSDFKKVQGKYTLVLTEEGDGGASSKGEGALGKLSKPQIEKGQAVLESIEAAINANNKASLTALSSEFFSLIPHNFGRQRPEPILTLPKLYEKVELLKFYLRMGFEEMEAKDEGVAPISGVMDLPLPASLAEAAKGLCSPAEVRKCVDKGKTLASSQAGGPVKAMDQELYASIMLYTGNAIYRDLNQALRDLDRARIRKYFTYLRLFLEALGRLPEQTRQLWRGIGADLFDQYPVGSTITWWGVSSCTSDLTVAKSFMNGCGGKKSLLTIHAKRACDISTVTFFSNEKENLLPPGTQLKVLKSARNGDVTEITLEEVGRCVG